MGGASASDYSTGPQIQERLTSGSGRFQIPSGGYRRGLMPLVQLVIGLAMVQFFFFLFAVGKARGTYKVPAPATTGNEVFERYFRVQMNTLELLVMFVPAMFAVVSTPMMLKASEPPPATATPLVPPAPTATAAA